MSDNKKPAMVAMKEQNEYIPAFITKKPFYVPDDQFNTADYLEHQRLQKGAEQSGWYERGKRLGPAATKFRKGACENCGAMTHKTKECLSRPRAKGARWTGKDIEADEVVEDLKLGWDAKRDRWNGYDPAEYQKVVEEYEALEALKKQVKKSGEEEEAEGGVEETTALANEDARYAEESDMGRHQSTATRNLRLREDTAKYLLNLDVESAKYDPKTRSMVDLGALGDEAAALVAEENFMRVSGDAAEFEKAQRYAWETQERGKKGGLAHLQANPTSAQFLRKEEHERSEAARQARQKLLMEKYGAQQQTKRSTALDAAVVENETYVEYDESGQIKGAPKLPSKSKYPEDVFLNNHTSVWGSWWKDFTWGYACCHSTIKNSYCTGEDGKRAFEEASQLRTGLALTSSSEPAPQDAMVKTEPEVEAHSAQEDQEKMKSKKKRKNKPGEEDKDDPGSKKRTAEAMSHGVTDADVEVHKRSRTKALDPRAKSLGEDEQPGEPEEDPMARLLGEDEQPKDPEEDPMSKLLGEDEHPEPEEPDKDPMAKSLREDKKPEPEEPDKDPKAKLLGGDEQPEDPEEDPMAKLLGEDDDEREDDDEGEDDDELEEFEEDPMARLLEEEDEDEEPEEDWMLKIMNEEGPLRFK